MPLKLCSLKLPATASGWTNPNNAKLDDTNFASTATPDALLVLNGFTFPEMHKGDTVRGISVVVKAKEVASGGTGTLTIDVDLSYDGTNYVTAKATATLTDAVENTYTLGGTEDLWGRFWTVAEVQHATNFKCRLKAKIAGGSGSPEWHVNVAKVNVHYYEAGRGQG
jgi:hypothetical protein